MLNEKPNVPSSFNRPPDDDQIGNLLSSLKRVEAPGDFEFRVRAGIAGRKTTASSFPWLTRALKVAGPASLLLALGGYLGLGSLYPPDGNETAAVAESRMAGIAPVLSEVSQPNDNVLPQPQSAQPMVVTPSNEMLADNINVSPRTTIATGNKNALAPEKKIPAPRVEESGGSYDIGLGESSNRIDLTVSHPNANSGSLGAGSVLAAMGITAAYTVSGWRVSSLSGAAQRSGMQAGDVIEAINGRALTSRTSFPGGFRGSSLTVRRDGKLIQITVR